MCVFKYHAFIFLIRPPRWQRETVSVFCTVFYEGDISQKSLLSSSEPFLQLANKFVVYRCDFRLVPQNRLYPGTQIHLSPDTGYWKILEGAATCRLRGLIPITGSRESLVIFFEAAPASTISVYYLVTFFYENDELPFFLRSFPFFGLFKEQLLITTKNRDRCDWNCSPRLLSTRMSFKGQ